MKREIELLYGVSGQRWRGGDSFSFTEDYNFCWWILPISGGFFPIFVAFFDFW